MTLPPLKELALVAAMALVASVFLIVAIGHFPREERGEPFKGLLGAGLLWLSIGVVLAMAALTILFVWRSVPAPYAIIVAGGAFLFAPEAAKPWPDKFVNGRAALAGLSAAALALGGLMAWLMG